MEGVERAAKYRLVTTLLSSTYSCTRRKYCTSEQRADGAFLDRGCLFATLPTTYHPRFAARLEAPILAALEDAGITAAQLAGTEIIGGASRIQMVKQTWSKGRTRYSRYQ